MKLYSYFRSSAAYRVRIALNLKNLPYRTEPVHLLQDGGRQRGAEYTALNPQKLVPALTTPDGVLTQSLAIIEYLDETCPEPPLLPADAAGRARVRTIAQLTACDIHPLNNLRVLQYLEQHFAADGEAKNHWYRHWINEGFTALETLLHSPQTGRFCHGDNPTLADCCLIPQVYNARRFGIDLTAYPTIARIAAECTPLPAFAAAAPENQPDAE
ncbi:maleylacetoacetate isomerase [Neisseria leonii]|uniref:maleylacetoacetate isomerase n=1 Tax=Neisseria leonii TaxID=2995413 RepID=UPI00237B0B39|nr:maleylacetoacetate isomerase [Neisseria sp. 3986]MDD9326305.1 maleylacetoacetate isomerase [Neisseria sp. 3986]